ncbi:MAG TPA: hypothetical protein VF832_08890, partial [Longimicrobiales bacterium]
MKFWDRWIEAAFGARSHGQAGQASLSAGYPAAALDDIRDRLVSGGRIQERDRWDGDRQDTLRQTLEAWRTNPLARRIVELTSQYVVGGGMGVECPHEPTARFLREFWGHRLNRMDHRVFELCDELTRSGELFLLLSTDTSGMSYLRAVPALDVVEIETAGNDLEQETRFEGKDAHWTGYDPASDDGQSPVMLHYTVNRPVGALRGESDLAPLLRWLGRYAAWLEDRARLNRFRFAFLYSVTLRGSTEPDRRRRQAELNAARPAPGSILVKDEGEEWEVISPRLESAQANEDGLALKKMICAGAGVPLHFLAEPESSTRTTAESAGGPTFRHYEQRQEYFTWLIADLLGAVVRRAALAGRPVDPAAEIRVRGTDVSARDNASLSVAASTVISAFASLRDRGLIDDAELLRMAYRFAGEVVDVEEMLRRGGTSMQRARP